MINFLLGRSNTSETRTSSNGRPYSLRVRTTKYRSSVSIDTSITFQCPTGGDFRITEETSFDRTAKALGISEEQQSSNIPFDERFYLSSDNPQFMQLVSQEPAFQEAVWEVFNCGANVVRFNGQELSATWTQEKRRWTASIFSPVSYENPIPDPDGCAASLYKVTEVIGRHAHTVSQDEAQGSQLLRITGWSIAIISLLASILYWWFWGSDYPPISGKQVFIYSLQFSVPVALILAAIQFVCIKGRSSSHKELAGIIPITIIASLFLGIGMVEDLNGRNDTSPPEVHHLQVQDIYFRRPAKSSTYNYYAKVTSWRPGQPSEEYSISENLYHSLKPGISTATVTTHKGKLGFEWRERVEFHTR